MNKMILDELDKTTNEEVLMWCTQFGFVCYECPKCGRFSSGAFASYHAQLHGNQTIIYNPLPQEKAN